MKEETQLQVVNIGQKEIETLVACSIIPKGTPPAQVQVFARVCGEKGLSPFSRQIYLMARKSNNETRYTTQTGIDGYRLLAERSGAYAGNDDYLFDEGLNQYQMIKADRKKPTIAIATVYKMVSGTRVPFTASAMWDAYYPGDTLGFMWKKMPFLMLGKCAEALAMRKAFPESLSGIYTDVEMEQADAKIEVIKPEEKKDEKKEVKAEGKKDDITAKVNGCKNVTELSKLYTSLTTAEQNEYKDLFTTKKGTFNGH